jgi:hypothetical protein
MRSTHPLYQYTPRKFVDPLIEKRCHRFLQTHLTTEYPIPRTCFSRVNYKLNILTNELIHHNI